jgi:hypothetical protein
MGLKGDTIAVMTGESSTWSRDEAVLWRRLSDGVLLLPSGAEEPLALGGLGAAVWEALDAPSSEHGLAAMLGADFGAAPDAIQSEVSKVLHELELLGLLRPSP